MSTWNVYVPSLEVHILSPELEFRTLWAVANGPLSMAVVVLNNSLVFHDLDNVASVFIHFTPGVLSYSLRWSAVKVEELYPGVFGAPLTEEAASNIVFMDIFKPAAIFYVGWWVLHFIWLIV